MMTRLFFFGGMIALSVILSSCASSPETVAEAVVEVPTALVQKDSEEAVTYNYVVTTSYMRNGMPTTGVLPITESPLPFTEDEIKGMYEEWSCYQVKVLSFEELSKPYSMTSEEEQLYGNWIQATGFLNAIRMTDKEYKRWLLAGSPENVWDYALLEQVYIAREKDAAPPLLIS